MSSQKQFNVKIYLVVIILLASGVLHSAFAQAGDVDLSFNNSGYSRFGFGGGTDIPSAAAVQADGKIVVVGSSSEAGRKRIVLLRYTPNGFLDTSFGSNGWRTLNVGAGDSEGTAIKLQEDGKILVAGTVFSGTNKDFALLRFNSDGSTDTAFGLNGLVSMDFTQADDIARAVAVQADNKILVVGTITNSSGNWVHIAVVRYNPDGSLDTGFNGSGRVTTAGGGATAVALQSDGKIVVGGACQVGVNHDFCAVRFTREGPLDPSFNNTGKAIATGTGTASSIAVQPDGKVVLGGYTPDSGGFTVVRYNSDGSLDITFDKDGKLLSGFLSIDSTTTGASSMNVLPDGRILLSGYSDDQIAAMRLLPDGSFDTSFNGTGTTLFTVTSRFDRGYASLVKNDGRIVFAGTTAYSDTNPDNQKDFLLTRLNPDGSIDISFGANGFTTTDVGDAYDRGKAIGVQADGKIVVAGNWQHNGTPRVGRLNPDGSFDTTFNETGKLVLPGSSGYEVADVVVQMDGKIIVSCNFGGSIKFFRLNSNGALDDSFGNAGVVEMPTARLILNAMKVQPDGKILVGGSLLAGQGLMLMRLNSSGTPDRTFGRNGLFTAAIGLSGGTINALALKPDGKILAAGMTMLGDQNTAFLLARFNSNGSVDTTFAEDGYSFTDVSPWYDFVTSMAVHSDGKIALGGYSRQSPFENEFAAVKYNENGSPDNSFNGNGIATKDLGSGLETKATGVAFQSDGRIVLSGHFSGMDYDFAAIRFHPDGSLDYQWGEQGIASADVEGDDFSYGMVLDPMGRLVTVGESDKLFSIVRFTTDTAPVSFVSVSGRVTDSAGNPINRATLSVTDSNGSKRTAQTNAFGYYRFDDVQTGAAYTFAVSAKRFRFLPQTVTVGGELTGVDFVPNEGFEKMF